LIEILADGVVKRFGSTRALDGVDLAVPGGALWGVVGADGAGKTTLLRCIAGLYRIDAGHVAPGRSGQARTGFAPQGFHLYPDLTVMENMTFFGSLYGMRPEAAAAHAAELFDFAGLAGSEHTPAGELSGGMKQKLTLVSALLHQPPVLLLDEPTTGVDPISRLEFWQLVERLHAQGTTILLASAYTDEVERCDQVVYLHRGRVAALGSPDQLRGGHETLEDAFVELMS
jgi:ABC-type multidrug transport system ATPase subunit